MSSKNFVGRTALHEAISQKNKAISKFLIKSGADTALLNSDGETALRLGILAGIADEELSEYFSTKKWTL